jgi:hypothetical protein
MASVPRPRCARGQNCYHVLKLRSEKPPTVTHEGELCEKCQKHYAEDAEAPKRGGWRDRVIEAIQTLRPGKAVLWDLFTLNPHNGGPGEYSDLGKVLTRLDAKTLHKLIDWLDAKTEEALERYERSRGEELCGRVRLTASMKALEECLPPDKALLPDNWSTPLPFDAAAYYTSSGRAVDLTTPILAAALAEALDQQRGYISGRRKAEIIEEKLGVPRTTLHDWFQRMEEVGMTWHKFTADQLEYVALGKKRGRPSKDE